MTDKDIIEKIKSIFGVGFITTRIPKVTTYKPQWVWCISNSVDIQYVCAAIYSHMGSRRQARIRELLRVCRSQLTKHQRRTNVGIGRSHWLEEMHSNGYRRIKGKGWTSPDGSPYVSRKSGKSFLDRKYGPLEPAPVKAPAPEQKP